MSSDYTELVARLREDTVTISEAMRQRNQAADAIESLQAEADRLREYERTLVRERNDAWEERNRLREELAAAQKDAERWRFYRDHAADCIDGVRVRDWIQKNLLREGGLNASIDAAMAKEKPNDA